MEKIIDLFLQAHLYTCLVLVFVTTFFLLAKPLSRYIRGYTKKHTFIDLLGAISNLVVWEAHILSLLQSRKYNSSINLAVANHRLQYASKQHRAAIGYLVFSIIIVLINEIHPTSAYVDIIQIIFILGIYLWLISLTFQEIPFMKSYRISLGNPRSLYLSILLPLVAAVYIMAWHLYEKNIHDINLKNIFDVFLKVFYFTDNKALIKEAFSTNNDIISIFKEKSLKIFAIELLGVFMQVLFFVTLFKKKKFKRTNEEYIQMGLDCVRIKKYKKANYFLTQVSEDFESQYLFVLKSLLLYNEGELNQSLQNIKHALPKSLTVNKEVSYFQLVNYLDQFIYEYEEVAELIKKWSISSKNTYLLNLTTVLFWYKNKYVRRNVLMSKSKKWELLKIYNSALNTPYKEYNTITKRIEFSDKKASSGFEKSAILNFRMFLIMNKTFSIVDNGISGPRSIIILKKVFNAMLFGKSDVLKRLKHAQYSKEYLMSLNSDLNAYLSALTIEIKKIEDDFEKGMIIQFLSVIEKMLKQKWVKNLLVSDDIKTPFEVNIKQIENIIKINRNYMLDNELVYWS